MKRRLLISGILLAIFSLLAGAGFTLMTLPEPVAAQGQEPSLRTVQVTGRGQVSATPDQAIIRLGVQTEANTADAALEENNEQMAAVISTTLGAGVDETDIQTQGFNLRPVYDTPDNGDAPELTGYRASNIVQITVRDLSQIGGLLDAAVSAGSNTIEGIQFEVSNMAELEAAAREAAVTNAEQKATQMVQVAGAELGPVHTILEIGGGGPLPVAVQEDTLESSVPIQPGTQSIEVIVQVTWEIQ